MLNNQMVVFVFLNTPKFCRGWDGNTSKKRYQTLCQRSCCETGAPQKLGGSSHLETTHYRLGYKSGTQVTNGTPRDFFLVVLDQLLMRSSKPEQSPINLQFRIVYTTYVYPLVLICCKQALCS
jgi:hypothetical protein